MSSSILTTVDYSAALAGRVQGITWSNGTKGGVRSVFGAGTGTVGDPLRPGQTIQPIPENPSEPYTHWSDLPDAPTIIPLSQSGLVQLEWTVPMRLFVPRGDVRTARQTLMPFYDGYLAQFVRDPTLGGRCLIAYIRGFKPDGDDDWLWLDMELHVEEEVHY